MEKVQGDTENNGVEVCSCDFVRKFYFEYLLIYLQLSIRGRNK